MQSKKGIQMKTIIKSRSEKIRSCIALAAMLSSFGAFAECYIAEGFEGQIAKQFNNYKFTKDRLAANRFMIDINGKNSSVTPDDLRCFEVEPLSIICVNDDAESGTIQTWAVDPNSGVVYTAKTMTGWGVLNGVQAFTGKIVGRCR